jgi:hypothetical protein
VGALTETAVAGLVLLACAGCSPEARRVRDGGPGADPGNKDVVVREHPDPRAADTTLWPGRAPAPAERLARGLVPPPTHPATSKAKESQTPIKPDVPPTEPRQRTFDRGRDADPRRPTGETR